MCTIIDWIILFVLGCCSVTDLRRKTISIYLLVIMSMIVVLSFFCCDMENIWMHIGGAGLGILFFIVSRLTKEAVGYGDSWLILLLGARLGIEKVLWLLFVASLGGAFVSLLYLWMHRWNRNATLPFVPFLTLAYLGVMFL